MSDVPRPPDRSEGEPPEGKPPEIADMRKHFRRTARDKARDKEAVRAFIESKVEMVRTDPSLSEAEKEAAIEEIRKATEES